MLPATPEVIAAFVAEAQAAPEELSIIANVLGLPVNRLADSDVSGAMGGALLGRMAATGEPATVVCKPPKRMETLEPRAATRDAYSESYARYRKLYPAIKEATR